MEGISDLLRGRGWGGYWQPTFGGQQPGSLDNYMKSFLKQATAGGRCNSWCLKLINLPGALEVLWNRIFTDLAEVLYVAFHVRGDHDAGLPPAHSGRFAGHCVARGCVPAG
jgi:hypothetical protein